MALKSRGHLTIQVIFGGVAQRCFLMHDSQTEKQSTFISVNLADPEESPCILESLKSCTNRKALDKLIESMHENGGFERRMHMSHEEDLTKRGSRLAEPDCHLASPPKRKVQSKQGSEESDTLSQHHHCALSKRKKHP
jgi:hypothetical protein